MLRGSQIVLLLAVAFLAVGGLRAVPQAPKATELKLEDGKARVATTLSKDDPKDLESFRKSPCKVYAVDLEANRQYRIDMVSKVMDSFLRVEGPDGKTIAQDDDSGGMLNARIVL